MIRNPFEYVVSPRVLSHVSSWGMLFMKSSPSVGIFKVRPRRETFAVACLHRRGIDTPKCYLKESWHSEISNTNSAVRDKISAATAPLT